MRTRKTCVGACGLWIKTQEARTIRTKKIGIYNIYIIGVDD